MQSFKSGLFLENTNYHMQEYTTSKDALMGGLITLKYHIIDFFKLEEVVKDMCLLKLM